jgi:hypothetical protein
MDPPEEPGGSAGPTCARVQAEARSPAGGAPAHMGNTYAAAGGGGLACAGAGGPTRAVHHNQAAIHPNKPQTSIPANPVVSVLTSVER